MSVGTSKSIIFDRTLKESRDYWLNRLEERPRPSNLALDYQRPLTFSGHKESVEIKVTESLCGELRRLTGNSHFLVYTTLLAVLKACLYKLDGSELIVVGSPSIKNKGEQEETSNVLAIVDRLQGQMSFRELLLKVRGNLLEAYKRQQYSFQRLVRDLNLPESSKCELFDILVCLKTIHADPPQLKNDLTITFDDSGQDITGRIDFETSLYKRERIERFGIRFLNILRQVLERNDTIITRINLLPESERHSLAYEFNATAKEYDRACFHQMFEEQVRKTPEAVAIEIGGKEVTYGELNREANRLGRFLRGKGVRRESVVGIMLERGIEQVVALLGVMKAGGAYLPIDGSQPKARVEFMVEDSNAEVVITREEMDDRIGEKVKRVYVDRQAEEISRESWEEIGEDIEGENLAYVIYTSGTTGKPKGVMVTHGGLSNYLRWSREAYEVRGGQGSLVHSPIGFDLTVTSLYLPLLEGKRAVLIREEEGIEGLSRAMMEEREYTLVKITPSHLDVMRQRLEGEQIRAKVKAMVIGGEALTQERVRFWQERSEGTRVINEYGPTETVVGCSVYEMNGEERGGVPIGRPIANTQIYVLNDEKEVVGIGEEGEIYIGGEGLARGYLNRADITAERFEPNPYSELGGGRMYRTGDIGRYGWGGELEYKGRNDGQVKIRGHRVEIGEIEEVMREEEGVREVAVVVRGEGEDKRVVGYVVVKEVGMGRDLRERMREKLPEYMVPAQIVEIEEMPLTENGKIDKSALPSPEREAAGLNSAFVAPRNVLEARLAEIWARLLGTDRISVEDNFFDLGGHSLLAVRMISRIRREFNVDVKLRSLFEAPTVAGLLEAIRTGAEAGHFLNAAPIERQSGENGGPLSFAQERLWFLDNLKPGTSAFNIPVAARLIGRLNVSAFERSLIEVARRQESLRTIFPSVHGQPVQSIVRQPTSFCFLDLSTMPWARLEEETQRLIHEDARRPFDLATGPLWRILLLKQSNDRFILLITMHHIISDGWSMSVLMREVATLYETFDTGMSSRLPDLPVQYKDFALWQRQALKGEKLGLLLEYWRRQLAGAPALLEIPADRARPAIQTFNGKTLSHLIPGALLEEARALSKREGVTLFMTLLAAFQTLLHSYTGNEDIVVGADVASRDLPETENLIGFFVNQLVLRTNLSGNPSFREILSRVREVALEAYAHDELPFDKLVDSLKLQRTLKHAPVFQAKIVLQNVPQAAVQFPGLTLDFFEIESWAAKFDVTLLAREAPGGLVCAFEYNTDLFDTSTIELMATRFEALLEDVTKNADTSIRELRDAVVRTERRRQIMQNRSIGESSWSKFRKAKPQKVGLRQSGLVKVSQLSTEQSLPLVIEPAGEEVDLAEWAAGSVDYINGHLLQHGAVLFRGFKVETPSEFERVASSVSPDLSDSNGELPRSNISGKTYSVSYAPPESAILWHNENTFCPSWPLKLWFFCVQPSLQGGETPIVDNRRVFERISPRITKRFIEKKIMYFRNYVGGIDFSWQTAYRTTDKSVVERYCMENDIEYEWREGDRLRTRSLRPAVAKHPKTGEVVWFNQATLWHKSCLEQGMRKALLSFFREDEMPRQCYYGDGTPIEDSVMEEVCEVYRTTESVFPWQKGDVLLVDNMLAAHARRPFVGPRQIFAAMGEIISDKDTEFL